MKVEGEAERTFVNCFESSKLMNVKRFMLREVECWLRLGLKRVYEPLEILFLIYNKVFSERTFCRVKG